MSLKKNKIFKVFEIKALEQLSPNEVEWSDFNCRLFAGKLYVAYIVQAAEQGCIVIDMLGVCSALDVPVVVPTVNDS